MLEIKPGSSRMFWVAAHEEAMSRRVTTAHAGRVGPSPFVTGTSGMVNRCEQCGSRERIVIEDCRGMHEVRRGVARTARSHPGG